MATIHRHLPADTIAHKLMPVGSLDIYARASLEHVVREFYVLPLRRRLAAMEWFDRYRIDAIAFESHGGPSVAFVARPANSVPLE